MAAEQESDTVHGVERREHAPILTEVHQADNRQEREPDKHDRTERLADTLGATRLHREQHQNDGCGDHQGQLLVFSKKFFKSWQRVQAFHCRADGHSRGEHGIGEERGAAEHGRNRKPCTVLSNQRVQRENAAFALVVDTHGDQHVFDGGDKRD